MINQGMGEGRTEAVDIKEYMAILLKRKWLVLICFLLSMAVVTVFLFTRQPIYRATLKMLVTQAGPVVPGQDVQREHPRTFYATQVDIMKSQTMLRRVQQRMKKTADEIRDNLADLAVGPVRGSDILLISVDSPSRDFAKDFANALAEEYLRFREEQRAQSSESALLALTREINRLSQEMRAANDRLLAYAKEHNMAMLERSDQLLYWRYWQLQNSLGHTAVELADAQTRKALIDSRSDAASVLALLAADSAPPTAESAVPAAPTMVPPRENPSTMGSPDQWPPADPSAALAASASPSVPNTLNPAGDQAANPAPQPPDGFGTMNRAALGAVSDAQAQRLFDLENQRRSLQFRLDEMRQFYKPRHPALIEAERQLQEVTDKIDGVIQFVREKAAADVQLARTKFEQIRAAAEEVNEQTFGDTTRLLELRVMRSDVDRIQTLYNALLSKLMQVDVSQSFSTRTVSVLEPAVADATPVYPKKVKGLLMAAFFGLGLGLALAFFIEYIDDSIKLAEEVERDLQLPFLGMIPAAQWNPDDLTAHRLDRLKQQGGVAESYRVVRSAIIFSTPKEKLRSMLVTSAVPREGKTTTCVNLAIGFSQIEERVLLIDSDLRRGEVHKYFGLEKSKGMAEVLLGEASPEEVIKHTDVPKLDVMTVGEYPANPAELLLGWRLRELLDWAHQHYDRVILDCPPVMGIADSAILGAAVEGVLFVIWAGRTSRRYVRVAKMTAVSRGAKIFGFILNNLEPGRVGYYHYYPYYYSYYSRGYYYAHHPEEEETKGGDIKGLEVPVQERDKNQIDDVY